MSKLFISIFLFLSIFSAQAAGEKVIRFYPEQLTFVFTDSDGSGTSCEHKLLTHVPWYRVYCGEREFTVDVWVDIAKSTVREQTKVTLMYSVSEGVRSSGQKLVQFNNHFTDVIVSDLTTLAGMQSSIDVQNGLASLTVKAQF